MANNIGVTTTKLPRIIGQTIDIDTIVELLSVTMVSGQLDLGAILFDENGTMGVCSAFDRDADGNPIYTIRTITLDNQIDVTAILGKRY